MKTLTWTFHVNFCLKALSAIYWCMSQTHLKWKQPPFDLSVNSVTCLFSPYVMGSGTGQEKSSPAVGGGRSGAITSASVILCGHFSNRSWCVWLFWGGSGDQKQVKTKNQAVGSENTVALICFSICVLSAVRTQTRFCIHCCASCLHIWVLADAPCLLKPLWFNRQNGHLSVRVCHWHWNRNVTLIPFY